MHCFLLETINIDSLSLDYNFFFLSQEVSFFEDCVSLCQSIPYSRLNSRRRQQSFPGLSSPDRLLQYFLLCQQNHNRVCWSTKYFFFLPFAEVSLIYYSTIIVLSSSIFDGATQRGIIIPSVKKLRIRSSSKEM